MGTIGTVVSEETRKKSRASHEGKKLSEETRAKMSEAHLRRWRNPETRVGALAAAASRRGRVVSAETRAKIGAGNAISLLGKTPPVEVRVKLSESQKKRWARLSPDERSAAAKRVWDKRSLESKEALTKSGVGRSRKQS